MFVIGIGSRTLTETAIPFIVETLSKAPLGTTFVSGGAKGADSIVEEFATRIKANFILHKADWEQYGKSAGHRRNEEMIDASLEAAKMTSNTPVIVLAFIDKPLAESKGTAGCIKFAQKRNVTVHCYDVNTKQEVAIN